MAIVDRFVTWAVGLAERRRVPDAWIRRGMRRVINARLDREDAVPQHRRDAFWQHAWEGPVALVPDLANEQHYEVPAAFFDLVLGPRRKYSSGWWPEGTTTLRASEDAMLRLSAERAGIVDGDSILDLGCGWGSFTLWAAEHFPSSQVVGVSNSAGQRASILQRADAAGLGNVEIITADINDFEAPQTFRRIVSVEMLEHVRNHREAFRRMRSWLDDDGAVFAHVFAHQEHAYPYESDGPASWMTDTFFTGGVMPSRRLLPDAAAESFELAEDWWIDGTHYSRTLEAWLDLLDEREEEARRILSPVYGDDLDRWIQRWRMFFMASSELFRYEDGSEWGVAHHRFVPRPAG